MSVREYVGARYVPLFMGNWNNTKTYEPLSIVTYNGSSFTSRQYVPTGIDINNETYWVETGNFNSQVEQYRQEVLAFDGRITNVENKFPVNTSDIADNAITSVKIANGTIATEDIADNAITSVKIANGTIATEDIADGAITSVKIANGTIATEDIADGAITHSKMAKSNFVLFGDSWTDFAAGFENWFNLGGLASILNCNLINFGKGGAGFINVNNLIQNQLDTATTQMTSEQIQNTKYVVVVGLVNDVSGNETNFGLPSSINLASYASTVRNFLNTLCNTFPNAKVVWAPDCCNINLNTWKFSNCVAIAKKIPTNDFQYTSKSFVVAPNLPFFWIGHTGAEVMREDNMHLNPQGAYAFAKCILAACLGQTVAPYQYSNNVTQSVNAKIDTDGNIRIHGYATKVGPNQESIPLPNWLAEFLQGFYVYNNRAPYIFPCIDGDVTVYGWLSYVGGSTLTFKTNQPEDSSIRLYF